MQSRKRTDVSLILPCYNESGLFTDSVRRITQVLELVKMSHEIIFVDDASTDGTQELIRKAVQERTNARAIFHAKNLGRGQTVVDGIHAAKGKIVGYIDIDCEVSPVYIPQIVTLLLQKKADMIIGKRFYRTSAGSIFREILSRGYQVLSDRLIGTGGRDTESGYKFFSRSKILPILKKPRHKGWFWDTEITVYADRAGLVIKEVPVLFLRRFDKHSSVHIVRDTVDYLINIWQLRKRLAHSVVG